MSTAIEPVPSTAVATTTGDRFEFIAVDQEQLAHAQEGLILWAERAQLAVRNELVQENEVLDHARAQKWAVAPHVRRVAQLERRRTFYGKVETALRDGYVVIPNFPMTAFAIRTKSETPRGGPRDGGWHKHEQTGQILPQGEGENRNPLPEVEREEEERTNSAGNKYQQAVSWPSEWQDEIEFPLALAKPVLMQRTGQALAKKLFDEIGVAADSARAGGDPIIIGRIRNPRSGRPDISFFLGWYFDPSRL